MWEAESGAELLTLSGHGCGEIGACAVLSAAYSADGSQIVTAGADGTVRVWYPTYEAWLAKAGSLVQRYYPGLTPQERERFELD